MEAKDLISINPQTVRNDPKLFEAYIEIYYSYTGRRPSCAGCSFSTDFNALKKRILSGEQPHYQYEQQNTKIMEQTFVVKDRQKIFTYLFPLESGRLMHARVRGAYMTEEFAEAYLDSAKDDEALLQARKFEFSVLPIKYREDEIISDIEGLLGEDEEETEVEDAVIEVEDIETKEEVKIDLNSMNVKDLKAFASELGLVEDEFKYLKKDELIKFILERQDA